MRFQNVLILLFIGISFGLFAQERIYFNDFESGNLNVAEYIGQPEISDHISFSVWTNNAGDFEEQEGVGGSSAISMLGNGTKSIFFNIQIEEGYELDITGYNFWVKKTKANQSWRFYMNENEYADGQTDFEGSYSSGNFAPALLNQTGEINVEFRVNGMGNGYYILDDFELFGEVRKICNDPLITTQPNDTNVCSGDLVEFSVETISGDSITYQWQILVSGVWQDLTNDINYSGVNTATLSIANTPLDFHQNNYRCIVIVDECEEESDQAELSVIALPETEPIIYNN